MKLKFILTAAALGVASFAAQAADTIKVGVLHSLSGTMAISETTLKDTVLMLIDEQNKKGGVMGKKLEAVVVDPASNWPLFAEKAKQLLISQDKVAVVFGCWTSVSSRKSVLPVFEEDQLACCSTRCSTRVKNSSKNVFYTGAAPNQQAIPAVEYLMSKDGWLVPSASCWLGTDYVYPRTTNKILRGLSSRARASPSADIMDQVHPVRPLRLPDHHRQDQEVLARKARRPRWCPPSTATPTCPSTRNWATRKSRRRPTCRWWRSRWVRKNSAGVDTKPLVGHLAAWNYFHVASRTRPTPRSSSSGATTPLGRRASSRPQGQAR